MGIFYNCTKGSLSFSGKSDKSYYFGPKQFGEVDMQDEGNSDLLMMVRNKDLKRMAVESSPVIEDKVVIEEEREISNSKHIEEDN